MIINFLRLKDFSFEYIQPVLYLFSLVYTNTGMEILFQTERCYNKSITLPGVTLTKDYLFVQGFKKMQRMEVKNKKTKRKRDRDFNIPKPKFMSSTQITT